MKKIFISMVPVFFLSCVSNYVYINRMNTPSNIVISELTLQNHGSSASIPLGTHSNYMQRSRTVYRTVRAPIGSEAFVLGLGINNHSGQKETVRLKEFILLAGNQAFQPTANNLTGSVWLLGLHEDKNSFASGADIYCIYVIPKGAIPTKIILSNYGEIPVDKK